MIKECLQTQFHYNQFVVRENLAGISHVESLQSPQPGGNCINWVIGHIVGTRNSILRVLGLEPIWPPAQAQIYERGAPALTVAAKALPLESIVNDYDQAQERIMAALERATDEDFAKQPDTATPVATGSATSDGQETVAGMLAVLSFHESYHVGQLGVLRRLAGKAGVLK